MNACARVRMHGVLSKPISKPCNFHIARAFSFSSASGTVSDSAWASNFDNATDSINDLCPTMKDFFLHGGTVNGRFRIRRGSGLFAKLACFIGQLPLDTDGQETSWVTVHSDGNQLKHLFEYRHQSIHEADIGADGKFEINRAEVKMNSNFRPTDRGLSERLLGGLLCLQKSIELQPSEELKRHIIDSEAFDLTWRSMESLPSSSCLDTSQWRGWRESTSHNELLNGIIALPKFIKFIRADSLCVPHHDGKGWYHQVRVTAPVFGRVLDMDGHFRQPVGEWDFYAHQ